MQLSGLPRKSQISYSTLFTVELRGPVSSRGPIIVVVPICTVQRESAAATAAGDAQPVHGGHTDIFGCTQRSWAAAAVAAGECNDPGGLDSPEQQQAQAPYHSASPCLCLATSQMRQGSLQLASALGSCKDQQPQVMQEASRDRAPFALPSCVQGRMLARGLRYRQRRKSWNRRVEMMGGWQTASAACKNQPHQSILWEHPRTLQ